MTAAEAAAVFLGHEPAIRLGVFGGLLIFLMGLEAWRPRRQRTLPRRARWPANLLIVALNTLVLRLVLPVLPVALAAAGQAKGWGVLPALDLPWGVAVAAAVLLLDLAIYLQHVLVHAVPVLWRLHRMHHADQDIDVTTGARFHPLEIVLSAFIKLGAVLAIGPSPEAVMLFEVLLNATAMFNHANLALPPGVDRVVRLLVVTPDMHRVHHSVETGETHSNFGFNFPWWDRLLGTYRSQPAAGHDGMRIGLPLFRTRADQGLWAMLSQPWRAGG